VGGGRRAAEARDVRVERGPRAPARLTWVRRCVAQRPTRALCCSVLAPNATEAAASAAARAPPRRAGGATSTPRGPPPLRPFSASPSPPERLPPPPPSLPYKVDTSRPSLRTNWTRLVPFPRAYALLASASSEAGSSGSGAASADAAPPSGPGPDETTTMAARSTRSPMR